MRAHAEPDLGAVGESPVQRDEALDVQRIGEHQALGARVEDKSLWSLMLEWDQGGGAWVPNGRPRYNGLTLTQAHSTFTNYYLNNAPPLGSYLAQPTAQRGL